MNKIRILSGNSLKILAALFMVIDHVGLLLLPKVRLLRYIGRLSFPIFAFMIAEGAKYTRNKPKHFLYIATLALICQIVYFVYDKSLYMSILVTFSLSILIIYALQNVKKTMFSDNSKAKLGAIGLFVLTVAAVYLFTILFDVDYGFVGILTPVFASIPDFKDTDAPESIKKYDNLYVQLFFMAISLFLLSLSSFAFQISCLLAIPILMLYSGKRGKLNLKYFFYLFYPLHLLALQGIAMFLG